MKGRKINYSPEELEWIKKHKKKVRSEAHKEFCMLFNRNDVTLINYNALCKRKGWLTGRTGQYSKGCVPLNKGKKMPYNANSARTQFKKGFLGGRAKEVVKPIGFERVTKDGYIERKINNDMPFKKRWRAVHLLRWEEKNGTLPNGFCLKCLDGNKSNTDPSNWECVSRSLLPRLAGRGAPIAFDDAPEELKPTLLAVAKLEQVKRDVAKERGLNE